ASGVRVGPGRTVPSHSHQGESHLSVADQYPQNTPLQLRMLRPRLRLQGHDSRTNSERFLSTVEPLPDLQRLARSPRRAGFSSAPTSPALSASGRRRFGADKFGTMPLDSPCSRLQSIRHSGERCHTPWTVQAPSPCLALWL